MQRFKTRVRTIIAGLKGKLPGKAEHKRRSNDDDLAPTRPYQVVRQGRGYLRTDSETVLLQPGFLVGRGESCHLKLTDPRASRVHASFTKVEGGWLLKDNASRNGTLVNGQNVDSKLLSSGDTIQIGETFILYEER